MPNYLDEDEELMPLDEEEGAPFVGPRRPFDRSSLPPDVAPAPPTGVLPDAPDPSAIKPGPTPEMRRIIGLDAPPNKLALTDAPVVRGRENAENAYADAIAAKPGQPQPKWWQRLAAGALGAAAGYSNAAGRSRNPIDPSTAEHAILALGYDRKLSDWKQNVATADAKRNAAKSNEEAWWKNRQSQRQEDATEAQSAHLQAQTTLANEQSAALAAGTKDQYMKVGDGVFDKKAGAWKVPPVNKNELMSVDAGWAKENLPMLTPDEDGQYWVPVKGLDAILTNVTKKTQEPRISNPQEVLLNPEKFTPDQVATAKRMFGEMHRPPVNNFMNTSEGEAALERTAQALANGDLTRIKDIASMRGDQRLRIFDRAKQINPKFSTGDIDRQIKMEDYYANGKGANNLQSFGTFLEHGGAAVDAAKALNQGNPKLLSKPVNWWRREMSGDPTFQTFVTALEPVRKEFEGFLLGGRALYGDDRKQAEIILNENSSLGQVMTALKAMGHTASARFNEENFRYKKIRHRDLEDPFTPEAVEGASKMGVALRGGEPSGGGAAAVDPKVKAYADQFFGGDVAKAQAAIDEQRRGKK